MRRKNYEGFVADYEDLLETAGIAHNEQINIGNNANGERFITYAISGEGGTA